MTVDTVGDTTNNFGTTGAPNIWGTSFTASASGALQSIGLFVYGAAGNIRVAIYSTLNGTPAFATLLGQSASVPTTNGWCDVAVTGVNIVQGNTYYIAFQVDNYDSVGIYYDSAVINSYGGGMAYGAFTDPSAAVIVVSNSQFYMRVTYNPVNPLVTWTRVH